jgi:hypothetical protein
VWVPDALTYATRFDAFLQELDTPDEPGGHSSCFSSSFYPGDGHKCVLYMYIYLLYVFHIHCMTLNHIMLQYATYHTLHLHCITLHQTTLQYGTVQYNIYIYIVHTCVGTASLCQLDPTDILRHIVSLYYWHCGEVVWPDPWSISIRVSQLHARMQKVESCRITGGNHDLTQGDLANTCFG